MEDTLFEYRYEVTDDFIKDIVKYLNFKIPARIISIAFSVFSVAAFAAYSTWKTVLDTPGHLYWWATTAVLAALYTFTTVFTYKKSLSGWKKRNKELYGDRQLYDEFKVTENEIHYLFSGDNSENSFAVSSFCKVSETKTMIVCRTRAGMFNCLSKNGFTKGTPEEFVKFLHSKGVK